MEIKKRIFYNIFISLGARILSVVIGIVVINLTTHYLGQNGYGEFSTILAFLFVFSIFADLGLYSITIKEISKSENNEEENKIVSNVFTLRFVSSLVFFSLAVIAGLFFPYSYQIKIGIFIGALGYLAQSTSQVLLAVFQKYLAMEKVAIAECSTRLVQLGLTFFFVHSNFGFFGIIWAFTISSLINLIILYISAKKYVSFKFKADLSFWKKIILHSYPLALGGVLTMFYFKFDTVLLSLMKPSADVGIYSLPYRILEILIFFPSIFTGLVMPVMSKYVLTDKDKFKSVIQKSLDMLILSATPLIIGTLLLSKKIIIFLSGEEFIKSADVFNILIFATFIIFISHLFYNIILVLDKQKSFIWIFGSGAVLNIILNIILIPRYSYIATSITTVITEFIVAGLMFYIISKNLKYLLSFKLFFKSLFASMGMGLGLYFIKLPLIIAIIFGILIYLIFLYLFKAISKEDISILIRKSA